MADKKREGLISRVAESAKKRALDVPDFIGNLPENTIGLAARYLIKKFGPEKASKMVQDLEKTSENIKESQLGSLGKKTGFVKKISEPETYKEKVADNLGQGFIDIISGGGALKTLSTLPKAISTIGGLLSQSLAQPKIEEAAPNSPALQTGLNILSGLGGASVASKVSKKVMKPKNIDLPKGTAGQLAELGSEKSDRLLAKQLDLSKKDYKSAKLLSDIQKKQHQDIVDRITPKEKTKGSEIVKAIDESFENMKQVRRQQYQADHDKYIMNYQGEAPDLTPVFDLIDKITSESSQGGKITQALGDINKKIHQNKGSLVQLNNTKSDIQALTQGLGKQELHLSDKQAALIGMVGHELEKSIVRAVPEIGTMNSVYKAQTQKLQALQNGVVGKSVKTAQTKPTEIFKEIFEKTDPEKIAEFRSVIPEELYDKAAQQYLGDVLKSSLGQPSRNQSNFSNKFFNFRSKLEKNRERLSSTLPEKYNKLVDEVIEDIKVSERGVPRNDFTIQSNRNVAVGDEAKGLGVAKNYLGKSIPSMMGAGAGYLVGGLPGAAVGTAVGTGASQIGNYMKNKALRNEMLTGLSPVEQITQAGANITPQIIQQSMLGESLTNPIEQKEPLEGISAPQQEIEQSDGLQIIPTQQEQKQSSSQPINDRDIETENNYGSDNDMKGFFDDYLSIPKGKKNSSDKNYSNEDEMSDFFNSLNKPKDKRK